MDPIYNELNEAVDAVLHRRFDFFFDRDKAKKVLCDWARSVLEDEGPSRAGGAGDSYCDGD